jgi:hypothetical protein
MKKLISIFLILFSFKLFANACPNLEGQYHCVLTNGEYSLLTIVQKTISEDRTQYSFDYSQIEGDPDVIFATNAGVMDSFGYLNKCENNRLQSLAESENFMSELYINSEKAFVMTINGAPSMTCPRKLSK